MIDVTETLHIARNDHILGRVNGHAGWTLTRRIFVGYTEGAFDKNRKIAIG